MIFQQPRLYTKQKTIENYDLLDKNYMISEVKLKNCRIISNLYISNELYNIYKSNYLTSLLHTEWFHGQRCFNKLNSSKLNYKHIYYLITLRRSKMNYFFDVYYNLNKISSNKIIFSAYHNEFFYTNFIHFLLPYKITRFQTLLQSNSLSQISLSITLEDNTKESSSNG